MFTQISGLPDHVIGIDISGKVAVSDYQNTFNPILAGKLKSHKRIDVVCRFEEGWEGFEAGVIWEDMRTGLGNLGHWGRVAIIVDSDWMETTIDVARHLWPGHLRHFDLDEFGRACHWVIERDRTTVECLIADNGVLQIAPTAGQSLTEDDFIKIKGVVDAHLGDQKSIAGIMILTQKFPGWESFGAMLSHLKFVRDHHRQIKRVALVTDSPMGKFADYAVDHFVKAEVKSFDYDDRKEAELWTAEQAT